MWRMAKKSATPRSKPKAVKLPQHIADWHDYIEREPHKHNEDIKKLKKLVEKLMARKGIWYDAEAVERFLAFCRTMRHKEGRWAGLPLELSLEQRYFAACVFGLKTTDKELKREVRYFREAILLVARKFGKSLFISAIAAYMLLADREGAPQVWTLATHRTQASIVYKNARDLLKTSAVLTPPDQPGLIWHTRRDTDNSEMLVSPLNNGYMKAGSKNSKGQDGLNPHCFIIDELHALEDRNTYDVFSSAQGARTQPLSVIISTFGFVREGIFDSIYDRCRKVLDGKSKGARLFPMIFRIDDDDDPDNPECWIKANPGIPEGRPTVAYLQGEYQKAKDDTAQLPSFLAKHLNRATNAADSFFKDQAIIDACAEELTEADYTDKYAVGGVDLAETTDLCCASALIPEKGRLTLIQRYFIAEARVDQNSKNDKMAYRSFCYTGAPDTISDELLQICPGPMVRKSDVTAWYDELAEKYKITFWAIAFDRWHGGDWSDEMEQHGYRKQDAEGRGVTFPVIWGAKTLSAPMKEFKAIVQDKVLRYSRYNGLLRWCLANVAVIVDTNGNIKPDKSHSNRRIDGFASALLAYIAYKQQKDHFDHYQP